jgi:hypothetical protein
MEKRMALKFENLPYFQNSEMMNHNMQRPIIADILFMKNLIEHLPVFDIGNLGRNFNRTHQGRKVQRSATGEG